MLLAKARDPLWHFTMRSSFADDRMFTISTERRRPYPFSSCRISFRCKVAVVPELDLSVPTRALALYDISFCPTSQVRSVPIVAQVNVAYNSPGQSESCFSEEERVTASPGSSNERKRLFISVYKLATN